MNSVFYVDGVTAPMASFWGFELVAPHHVSDPIRVTKGMTLQFLPVLQNAKSPGGVQLDFLKDGAVLPVGTFEAHYILPDFAGEPSNYPRLSASIVRLDLSEHAGSEITPRWTPKGGGEGARHSLALFKVLDRKQVERLPNILMICSDTHRADCATEGEGSKLMPRMHAFRSDAVTYRRAYSNATWTLPSIASTMTGRFARFHRTGRRGEKLDRPSDLSSVPSHKGEFWLDWAPHIRYFSAYPSHGVSTFCRFLNERGYSTAWIVGNSFYTVSGMERHGPELILDARNLQGDVINDIAFQLLSHGGPGRPLFLLVHYMDVHHYRHWVLDKKFPGKMPLQVSRDDLIESYHESVREADRLIGQLLKLWEERMGFENSLVVFWSDHGEHLRDPGYPSPEEWEAMAQRSGTDAAQAPPFFDHGNSMDETLLHVPLIVRYPDAHHLKGEVFEQVSLVDLFPTILEVADASCGDYEYDGRSLLKLGDGADASDGPVFADYQLAGHEMSSVRQGTMKYVLQFDETGKIEGRSLVDLSIESGEKGEPGQRIHDSETTARMERVFLDYAKAAEAATLGMKSDVEMNVQRDAQSLRDAGYVAK